MKTKLVIWGTDATDARVLMALELLPEKNEVAMYVFPEEVATDDFVKVMMDDWRFDRPVEFPSGHQRISRPLTMSESLLPDEYKVERGEIIQRAQSEWAFVVLSYKMKQAFQSQLEDFRDKISALEQFSQPLWDEMKVFWEKVQHQANERNLFRDHVELLRNESNDLFGQLKRLRQNADAQFRKQSNEIASAFTARLDEVVTKIAEGKHLINTFDTLKKLQQEYHGLQMTRDDRNKIWDKMDAAFKALKEKRFGNAPAPGAAQGGMARLEARMKGLLEAIQKMVRSIEFDEKDLHFESKRAHESDGQLEAQLRQAKIAMIEERIRSKREKLADMERTKADIESKMESQRRRIAEEEEKLKIEQAKAQIKERIAQEISETEKELQAKAPELEAAAKELATQVAKKSRPKKGTAKADSENTALQSHPAETDITADPEIIAASGNTADEEASEDASVLQNASSDNTTEA